MIQRRQSQKRLTGLGPGVPVLRGQHTDGRLLFLSRRVVDSLDNVSQLLLDRLDRDALTLRSGNGDLEDLVTHHDGDIVGGRRPSGHNPVSGHLCNTVSAKLVLVLVHAQGSRLLVLGREGLAVDEVIERQQRRRIVGSPLNLNIRNDTTSRSLVQVELRRILELGPPVNVNHRGFTPLKVSLVEPDSLQPRVLLGPVHLMKTTLQRLAQSSGTNKLVNCLFGASQLRSVEDREEGLFVTGSGLGKGGDGKAWELVLVIEGSHSGWCRVGLRGRGGTRVAAGNWDACTRDQLRTRPRGHDPNRFHIMFISLLDDSLESTLSLCEKSNNNSKDM